MDNPSRKLAPKNLHIKRTHSQYPISTSPNKKVKGLKLSITSLNSTQTNKSPQQSFIPFFQCNTVCVLPFEDPYEIDGDLWSPYFDQDLIDSSQNKSHLFGNTHNKQIISQESSSNSTVATFNRQQPKTPINKLANFDQIFQETNSKSKGIMLISSTYPDANQQRRPSLNERNLKMAHSTTRLVTDPKNIFNTGIKQPINQKYPFKNVTPTTIIRFNQQKQQFFV